MKDKDEKTKAVSVGAKRVSREEAIEGCLKWDWGIRGVNMFKGLERGGGIKGVKMFKGLERGRGVRGVKMFKGWERQARREKEGSCGGKAVRTEAVQGDRC